MYFDSHAHLTEDCFAQDFDSIVENMKEASVTGMMEIGFDLSSSEKAVRLAERFSWVHAAVGSHPDDAAQVDEARIAVYRELCKNPRVKAIGEIGLDYYWPENPPRDFQQQVFRAQLELALELDLPVIIHDREAHGDSLRIVCDYPGLRGVFHCFSGSVEMARELLRRGWYLGFDGPITYKNAVKALDVIAACPTDRMLLETDSPYLAPVPNRGKRNDSRNLPYIAARIAEIKSMTTEEVAEEHPAWIQLFQTHLTVICFEVIHIREVA